MLSITILAISFWLCGSKILYGFSVLYVYLAAPQLITIGIACFNKHNSKWKHTICIAGVLGGFVSLFPYYSTYTYAGRDGQTALTFAVMPFYQLAFMFLVFIAGLFVFQTNPPAEKHEK